VDKINKTHQDSQYIERQQQTTMKSHISQIIKLFGIMAIVAAFAAAAFPAPTSAASIRGGYGKVNIYVSSYDPSGAVASVPVEGAVIEIIASNGASVMKAVTDSAGSAHIGLDAGTYKVRITARGYYPGGSSLKISNGTVQDLAIRLTPTVSSVPSLH
jgi:hypothetical protein